MAVTKRDVQLVIKARDEATRVVDKYADSISKLIAQQDKAGSSATGLSGDIVGLVAALANVEKANGLVGVAAERADRAFKRQSTGLAEARAELAATKAQILGVQQAINSGPQRIVDTLLGGGEFTKQLVTLKNGAQVVRESVRDINSVRAELAGAATELTRLTVAEDRLSTSVRTQESALGQQRSSLQQIYSIANTTERALVSLGNETERAAIKASAALEAETQAYREQARAAKEAADAKRANDRFSAFAGVSADPGGGRAAVSAAVFQDQARMADAAERLLQRTQPLYAIQVKLDRELEHAATLYKKGAITAAQYEHALEALKLEAAASSEHFERIGRGSMTPSLFGMKPYELQNMGYQINDVVTQLASGTPALQVMAQQGGQILQLLPNIGTALIAALTNPVVLGAVAVLGTLAVVFGRASSEAERMRNIEGMMARIADSSRFSAIELERTAKALEKVGLSGEEALGQVEQFVTKGLNPDYLITFSKAAIDLADVTGQDVPEAAAAMRDAFTGGYEAVAELDDKMGFLTLAEREQIRAMYESGDAASARELAFRLFNERLRESKKASEDAKGAVESLGGAVNDFLTALANTDAVQTFTNAVRKEFQDLARDIRQFAGTLSLSEIDGQIEKIQGKIAKVKDGDFLYVPGLENYSIKQMGLLAVLQNELNDLLAEKTRLTNENAKATGDLVDVESNAVKKRRSDREKEIQDETRAATATTDAAKARIAGEQAYKAEMAKSGDEYLAAAAKKAATDVANHNARMRQLKKEEAALKGTVEFGSPLRGNPHVTSGFGKRIHPISGKKSAHPGVDYAVPTGTPAYAPASGTVEKVEVKGKNGLYIKMNHGSGTESYFLHMSQAKVKEGDFIDKGDLVGLTGGNPRNADGSVNRNAGSSTTGPHLHYAMKVGGEFVDPTKTKRAKADPGKAMADAVSIEEKRVEQQEKLNEKIDDENARRQRSIEAAMEQAQLEGDALFDAQKRKSINDAVFTAMQDASRQGLELDKARREEIERTVGAEWDLANARERSTAAVDSISGERQAILSRLDTAKQLGDTVQANVLEAQIEDINAALKSAIETAIKFWSQFNTAESRTAIEGLRALENTLNLDSNNRGREDVERPVDQLEARRAALMEQIQFYQDLGQSNVVGVLREQLSALDGEFLKSIDTAIAYWQSHNGPDAEAAIANLENMRNQVIAAREEFAISARQIQDAFSGSLSDSVKLFATTLVDTGNPLKAFAASALNFASSFTQKIADMLLQMWAMKLALKIGFGGEADKINDWFGASKVSGASKEMMVAALAWQFTAAQIQAAAAALAASGGAGGGGGGSGGGFGILGDIFGKVLGLGGGSGLGSSAGSLSNSLFDSVISANAGIFHTGGIAGAATVSRAVAPAWFANATKYHGGGIAGFKPDELPAILQRNEEILTTSDPRHRFNGGGQPAAAPNVDVKIVNAIDSASVVEEGLNTRAGQKAILNFLRANSRAVQSAMAS